MPLLAVMFILLCAADAAAQGPGAPWRTTATASFRVHYPEPYEAWALRLAARLDSIREQVAREIGYVPPTIVDVVVMDPFAAANGYAVPFLGSPRMVLWTRAPPPDSVIGHYAGWGELLAVHEDVHLVQLLRPSRNPTLSVLERILLPFGPIAIAAPRWATEGYATVLEGRLTGLGRPHSDIRAAILRRWAQQGRLPSYERLSADRERWMGMSMAYLAGSAYLEWLLDRAGPDSLRHVWARLTARQSRTFDAAFRGVYGESPDALYGRFVAELSRESLELEALIEPSRRDGELWQRFEWTTGAPALAADGSRLAVVLHERERPARLVVFDTGPDEQAERERRERIERMLARDPEDVAPVLVAPAPRQPVHVLPAIHGAEPHWPRWMPDGESILFARFERDADGFLHPDLFRWWPADGRVDRLTRFANLHGGDPAPDGSWAAAVRQRHGYSQLVRVDLATGEVSAITAPSVEIVYDSPRVSPDGRWIAYLRNDDRSWRAIVRDLDDGTEISLPIPPRTTVANPAWSADGRTLYLSVGEAGFIDIHAFPVLDPGPPRAITRTHGAALAAAPAPAPPAARPGLYFLSLESHGLDLRWLQLDGQADALPDLPPRPIAALPPAPPSPPEWQIRPVERGRPYGIGRQEFLPLVGGAAASSARALELGVRGGDLLGRLSYLAIGSFGARQHGPSGVAFGLAWRPWPVTLRTHLFGVEEAPSRHLLPDAPIGQALDVSRRGGEMAVEWERLGRPTDVRATGGVLIGRVQPASGDWIGQRLAFGEGGYISRLARGQWHVRHGATLRADVARTAEDPWQRLAISVEGGAGYGRHTLVAALEQRSVHGSPAPFDRVLVGGMPSSVLPPAVLAGRVVAPPLPLGALSGDEHRAVRLEWRRPGPRLFYERHQVRDRGAPWAGAHSWIGAEVGVTSRPVPLLMLPAVDARLGIARMFDRPAGARLRWWAGIRWVP